MFTFFLFFSLLAFTHGRIPYDSKTDCNLLFAKDGQISPAPYDYTLQHCAQDTEAPTTAGPVNTHVYHFNEKLGWVDDEIHEIVLTAAREALTETINVYSTFATMPEVYLFVVSEGWNKNEYADTWIAVAGEPCRIRLLYDNVRRKPMAINKQTIAHELWHCVQYQHFGTVPFEASGVLSEDWWAEGGAEFFSAIVYPQANDEWVNSRWYDPSVELYKQSYRVAAFFEWIYNNPDAGTSVAAIWEWMKTFTVTRDWNVEAARIAALPEMARWFTGFIQALVDDGVPDTDGINTVPQERWLPHHHFKTTLSKTSPSSEHTIKVNSFTGDISITKLKDGQTIGLSYTAQSDKLKVKYKLGSKDKWVEMKVGEEIELVLPCGQDGELKFLTTNVAATEESLTVKIVGKDKKECKHSCSDKPPLSLFAPKASLTKRFIQGDSRFSSSPHVVAAVDSPNIDPETGEELPADELPVDNDETEEEDDEEDDCEEAPSNTTLSTCLIGSWSLNLPAMTELIKKAMIMPDIPELQISNIAITGSSVMSISDTWVGNWTYTSLTVAFDVNVADLGAQHTKTTLNGDMSFNVVDVTNSTGGAVVKRQADGAGEGDFTMDVTSAQGTAVSYSPLVGEINWPIDENYAPPDLVLKYVCSGSTLALTGFVGGAAQGGWVYAFERV